MSSTARCLFVATRGSPLALTQTRAVVAQCERAFPELRFELKVIKTTGDKLQTAALGQSQAALPKGLFTKELEVALLSGEADLAVHSLKDLPTDLPAGLTLGAVGERADPRDVLIYRAAPTEAEGPGCARGFPPNLRVADLPPNATVATSSTRRKGQLLERRPDLSIVEMRGNVGTRLRKLAEQAALDATLLAAAGLARLGFRIEPDGSLLHPADPPDTRTPSAQASGLLASFLAPEVMLPCVGQAAVGVEIRAGDQLLEAVCQRLEHAPTRACVTAERAFLRAMGGGCQSPVAAYAVLAGQTLWVRALSFRSGTVRRGELRGVPEEAAALGVRLAAELGGE